MAIEEPIRFAERWIARVKRHGGLALALLGIVGVSQPASEQYPGWLEPPSILPVAGEPPGGALRISEGPPRNLEAGAFQSLVDRMWRHSPTFRRQCSRVAAERALTVTVRLGRSNGWDNVRAATTMSLQRGILVHADVVLFSLREAIELIAHEIEHVIEHLDGVQVRDDGCGGYGNRVESCRAVEAGRRVAGEVDGSQRARIVSVRQRSFGGPLDQHSARVSADGRFVVLVSEATLVPEDTNDDADVYVLDLETNALELNAFHLGWPGTYSGRQYPGISRDGGRLVFQIVVSDDTAGSGHRSEVVTLDRTTGNVRAIEVERDGRSRRSNQAPAISADGTTVVFASTPVKASPDQMRSSDVYLVRLETGHVEKVSAAGTTSSTPTVSGDGRYVAFASADLSCGGTYERRCPSARHPPTMNIYVRDTKTDVTTRVSSAINGEEPDGPSAWPAISDDGRYIAFGSEASNLVSGDTNRASDIFVHDRLMGTTALVSRRPDGRPGNGLSRNPTISGDGTRVAFQSLASDLICVKRCTGAARDINLLWDVFVFERGMHTMFRASGDDTSEWMEPSRRPSLDHSGCVLVFSSRHPIDGQDVDHDDDLFIRISPRRACAPAGNR